MDAEHLARLRDNLHPSLPVLYVPELFQPDIPVVMEGRFVGDRYVSDRILVKHSEEYEAENEDRLVDARSTDADPAGE